MRNARSVRQGFAEAGAEGTALVVLLVATEVFAGWRVLGPSWLGSDLLYHSALANAVLRGELPPGGPYPGLPAYYPPGFHVLVAGIMAVLGIDFTGADRLLTMAWLPVLPLGTFLLMRWLTGRSWVALVAATLTVFAGGYDLNAGRLWVNSLFVGGQEAYPVYPRDLVFGMLPFAVLAFLRALAAPRASRAWAWAVTAGALFGACALIQVQLLLPMPAALATGAVLVALSHPNLRWRCLGVLVVTGAVAAAMFAPWFAGQLDAIGRNGGVDLQSSDTLLPARFGPWSYPREFGLVLPLAIVGSGVALLLLRREDGPRPGGAVTGPWRPSLAQAPMVLVAWCAFAFVLAVLYRTDWPLEDALHPQRLWLLSSQPMAMLAAVGLATLVEDSVGRLRGGLASQRRRVAATAVVMLVACVPATVATARLLGQTWQRPTYADLDLQRDRVPAFAALIPRRTDRATVFTYEDWSALVWFETGERVVAMEPAGFAKLAFDPAVFTSRSQEGRRADLLAAFDGDPGRLGAAATSYGASYLVLARRGDEVGLLDAVAAVAAGHPGNVTGTTSVLPGNGWDSLALETGATLAIPVAFTGSIGFEIRVAVEVGKPVAAAALELAVIAPDGEVRSTVPLGEISPAADGWAIVHAAATIEAGDSLRLRATAPVTIQSLRGFAATTTLATGASPIPGWRITMATTDAVLLEPVP